MTGWAYGGRAVSEPETERVVILLRERPPAAVAMRLHRLLGIGAAEVLKRADDAQPLLDRGLWLNDRIPLAHLLRDVVDAVAGLAFDVHVVAPEGAAGPDTVTDVQVLWNMLLADREAPPAVRPEPDLELARAIADATRAALSELPGSVADDLCAVALVTTGDGLRPYLTVTVDVDERWDLAASEFALIGDEHFEALRDVWDARGDLYELDDEALDVEFAVRLATLEEALRLLDIEGVFGAGEARQQVLLLVATMPPDPSDAAYARRLNPDGPRFRDWLREASEAPELVPAPPYSEATPTVDVTPPGRCSPNCGRSRVGFCSQTARRSTHPRTSRNATRPSRSPSTRQHGCSSATTAGAWATSCAALPADSIRSRPARSPRCIASTSVHCRTESRTTANTSPTTSSDGSRHGTETADGAGAGRGRRVGSVRPARHSAEAHRRASGGGVDPADLDRCAGGDLDPHRRRRRRHPAAALPRPHAGDARNPGRRRRPRRGDPHRRRHLLRRDRAARSR